MSVLIPASRQHIEATPGVCGGKPCIVGTRIRVWDIASRAQAGESIDEILGHFPQVSLSDVYAALAYYYDNQADIDRRAAEDMRFAGEFDSRLDPGLPGPRTAASSDPDRS